MGPPLLADRGSSGPDFEGQLMYHAAWPSGPDLEEQLIFQLDVSWSARCDLFCTRAGLLMRARLSGGAPFSHEIPEAIDFPNASDEPSTLVDQNMNQAPLLIRTDVLLPL